MALRSLTRDATPLCGGGVLIGLCQAFDRPSLVGGGGTCCLPRWNLVKCGWDLPGWVGWGAVGVGGGVSSWAGLVLEVDIVFV